MASLTRDEILALRAALPRRPVDVPEFGTVEIRTLTLKEVGEIQRKQKEYQGEPLKMYPDLIRAACVDDAGQPLFVAADADLIESLPWTAVDALATAILKFNRMAGDDSPKAPSAAPNGSN